MMRRIGVVIILSILLGTLAMPLAGASDSGKLLVKDMVQSPAEYSIAGLMPWDYQIPGERYYIDPSEMLRQYTVGYRLFRLISEPQ